MLHWDENSWTQRTSEKECPTWQVGIFKKILEEILEARVALHVRSQSLKWVAYRKKFLLISGAHRVLPNLFVFDPNLFTYSLSNPGPRGTVCCSPLHHALPSLHPFAHAVSFSRDNPTHSKPPDFEKDYSPSSPSSDVTGKAFSWHSSSDTDFQGRDDILFISWALGLCTMYNALQSL